MSDRSPEIDCNCDTKMFIPSKIKENLFQCVHCSRQYYQIPDGPDDFTWEEVE